MENMLQKIRNAVSPADKNYINSNNFPTSPRTPGQLTPLNASIMSIGPEMASFDSRDVESRQSRVCRKVIEEFSQKYSTMDKKRGSINPRR